MTRPFRMILPGLAAVAVAGCSVFGGEAAREPAFGVVEAEAPFEIREYPALTVAQTRVAADWRPAVNAGFGRLFDYISGANEGGRDIAMTAPVLTEPTGDAGRGGEKIAMTAPVLTEPGEGGWTVAFVLPDGMTADTAPRPTDPTVEIATLPARRVAVARFSGRLTAESIGEARAALVAWLEARGLPSDGAWQAAGYNPPWTIPALRRNEVLITLPAPPG